MTRLIRTVTGCLHLATRSYSSPRVGLSNMHVLNRIPGPWAPTSIPWQTSLTPLHGLIRFATTIVQPKLNSDGQPMQIILTERAGEQLTKVAKDQNKPDLMLRVVVESGGCYGFQYKFKLTTETTDEDAVFENAGGRLVIDDVSLSLLEGATIDYVTELIGSSFQVVKIPKSSSGCGCGTSFDIQL